MAFKKNIINDINKLFLLVLCGLPLIASTNIDCNGRPFRCVNSTHFMICVDLGGGTSQTVDEFTIMCPPPTACRSTNHFECEFAPVTSAPTYLTSESTTESKIETTTSLDWEVMNTKNPNAETKETGSELYENYFNTVVSTTTTTPLVSTMDTAITFDTVSPTTHTTIDSDITTAYLEYRSAMKPNNITNTNNRIENISNNNNNVSPTRYSPRVTISSNEKSESDPVHNSTDLINSEDNFITVTKAYEDSTHGFLVTSQETATDIRTDSTIQHGFNQNEVFPELFLTTEKYIFPENKTHKDKEIIDNQIEKDYLAPESVSANRTQSSNILTNETLNHNRNNITLSNVITTANPISDYIDKVNNISTTPRNFPTTVYITTDINNTSKNIVTTTTMDYDDISVTRGIAYSDTLENNTSTTTATNNSDNFLTTYIDTTDLNITTSLIENWLTENSSASLSNSTTTVYTIADHNAINSTTTQMNGDKITTENIETGDSNITTTLIDKWLTEIVNPSTENNIIVDSNYTTNSWNGEPSADVTEIYYSTLEYSDVVTKDFTTLINGELQATIPYPPTDHFEIINNFTATENYSDPLYFTSDLIDIVGKNTGITMNIFNYINNSSMSGVSITTVDLSSDHEDTAGNFTSTTPMNGYNDDLYIANNSIITTLNDEGLLPTEVYSNTGNNNTTITKIDSDPLITAPTSANTIEITTAVMDSDLHSTKDNFYEHSFGTVNSNTTKTQMDSGSLTTADYTDSVDRNSITIGTDAGTPTVTTYSTTNNIVTVDDSTSDSNAFTTTVSDISFTTKSNPNVKDTTNQINEELATKSDLVDGNHFKNNSSTKHIDSDTESDIANGQDAFRSARSNNKWFPTKTTDHLKNIYPTNTSKSSLPVAKNVDTTDLVNSKTKSLFLTTGTINDSFKIERSSKNSITNEDTTNSEIYSYNQWNALENTVTTSYGFIQKLQGIATDDLAYSNDVTETSLLNNFIDKYAIDTTPTHGTIYNILTYKTNKGENSIYAKVPVIETTHYPETKIEINTEQYNIHGDTKITLDNLDLPNSDIPGDQSIEKKILHDSEIVYIHSDIPNVHLSPERNIYKSDLEKTLTSDIFIRKIEHIPEKQKEIVGTPKDNLNRNNNIHDFNLITSPILKWYNKIDKQVDKITEDYHYSEDITEKSVNGNIFTNVINGADKETKVMDILIQQSLETTTHPYYNEIGDHASSSFNLNSDASQNDKINAIHEIVIEDEIADAKKIKETTPYLKVYQEGTNPSSTTVPVKFITSSTNEILVNPQDIVIESVYVQINNDENTSQVNFDVNSKKHKIEHITEGYMTGLENSSKINSAATGITENVTASNSKTEEISKIRQNVDVKHKIEETTPFSKPEIKPTFVQTPTVSTTPTTHQIHTKQIIKGTTPLSKTENTTRKSPTITTIPITKYYIDQHANEKSSTTQGLIHTLSSAQPNNEQTTISLIKPTTTTKSYVTERVAEEHTKIKNNSTSIALDSAGATLDTKTDTAVREPNKASSNNRTDSKQVTFTCKNRVRGRYSDRTDCTKFYVCIGIDKPIEGACPRNTVFSDINKQCTKNLSHCIRDNVFRCVTQGRFLDVFRKNVYYICLRNRLNKYVRFQFQCQNGFILDKSSVSCTRNKNESHHNHISRSKHSQKESDSNSTVDQRSQEDISRSKKEKFECEKEGKFYDPKNRRRYYECKKNKKSQFRRKRRKCDKDEIFDKDKKKCVSAESYEESDD